MSYEGIFTGIATRSLPPMFIIRVISKNGKNIEEDDDSNSRIVFESVEEYEEINEKILRELEPNDKIKFDLNSERNIVNSTLRKI
jgi:hypothetical protein